MARLQEVVWAIRLISIRFELSWERKACPLIRLTFYSHAQWGIRDKSLFRLVHYKRSGVDNRTSSPKTRQIHRIHGIGDRGSVAFSLLNLPLTHQTDHPEFWPVFSAIVLTHNYVSTAVLPSPRCAPRNGRVYAGIYRAESNQPTRLTKFGLFLVRVNAAIIGEREVLHVM